MSTVSTAPPSTVLAPPTPSPPSSSSSAAPVVMAGSSIPLTTMMEEGIDEKQWPVGCREIGILFIMWAVPVATVCGVASIPLSNDLSSTSIREHASYYFAMGPLSIMCAYAYEVLIPHLSLGVAIPTKHWLLLWLFLGIATAVLGPIMGVTFGWFPLLLMVMIMIIFDIAIGTQLRMLKKHQSSLSVPSLWPLVKYMFIGISSVCMHPTHVFGSFVAHPFRFRFF
jgi:hypothetical protein